MKTEFEFNANIRGRAGIIEITWSELDVPYVRVEMYNHTAIATMKSKDLERFAVNILKALKSKRLTL